MKKLLLNILMLLCLSAVATAQNESIPELRNALKISPFEFVGSKFQVTYERTLQNNQHHILFMPGVILKDNGLESKKGFEAMLQYRIMLTQLRKNINYTMGMHGINFYTGTYANGLLYTEKYQSGYYDEVTNNYITKGFKKEISAVEGGVLIGLEFDITSRIVLDFYVGGGVRYADTNDTYDKVREEIDYYYTDYGVLELEYTGIKPKLGMQLGFSF